MKVIDIRQTTTLKAAPDAVYKAMLNPRSYAQFTGKKGTLGKRVGDSYLSFDGFVDGVILELGPGRKIVRSWRARKLGWPEDHYSQVSMTLNAVDGGTKITCVHKQVPLKLAEEYKLGWAEQYWQPLKAWFSRS